MEHFWNGFEKRATEAEAVLAGLAVLGGLGALSGHAAHVSNKVLHAREGKDYKPETFIEKNPKAMGAATLGLAPLMSMAMSQRERDRENPRVRKVMKEHPFMTAGM